MHTYVNLLEATFSHVFAIFHHDLWGPKIRIDVQMLASSNPDFYGPWSKRWGWLLRARHQKWLISCYYKQHLYMVTPPGTYLCSTYLLHLIFSKKDNFHFQWHKLICFISYHPKRITSNDTNSSASSDLLTQGPLPMQSFICSTPSWRKTEKNKKKNEKKRKHLDLW
jgi:hypothetical protein